jgi:TP901 family phage tail tape measure protein
MAGERVVRYIITGDSAGAVRAMKQTEEAAGKAGKRLEETGSRMKSLGSGMSSFGHKLSSLSLPLLAVGGYAIKSAMDFTTSMTQLRTQAGASALEISKMSAAIEKGSFAGKGPNELAQALYPIESVGLRGSKALNALHASAQGAAISGAGLTEVADALSGALGTGMYDIKSASGAMDAMNKVVGIGKLHLSDLTEAFATGILPAAKTAGLEFRDVGAAIDAMTRQGIPASVEATRLRTNLSQFEAPKGGALKALRSIGLGQYTLAEDLRKPNGLIVALTALKSHLATVGQNEQGNVLARAFGGARGSANVAGLLNALSSMTSIRAQLQGAGGKQFAEASKVWEKTPQAKMDEALAQGKKALVSLGQTLIPIVIPALEKVAHAFAGIIQWVGKLPKPIREGVVGFTAFLAIGGPILIFIGSAVSAIGTLTAAFGAFDIAMLANPIGLAVVGMAALAAGAIYAYNTFKPFRDIVNAVWSFISHHWVLLGAIIAGPFIGLGLLVAKNFNAIVGSIRSAINAIISVINTAIGAYDSLPGILKPTGNIGKIPEIASGAETHPRHTAASRRAAPVTPHGGHGLQLVPALPGGLPPIHITVHHQSMLNGRPIAEDVSHHVRNSAEIAKPMAEGITKYIQHRAARE